jgi:hypothetical protein
LIEVILDPEVITTRATLAAIGEAAQHQQKEAEYDRRTLGIEGFWSALIPHERRHEKRPE